MFLPSHASVIGLPPPITTRCIAFIPNGPGHRPTDVGVHIYICIYICVYIYICTCAQNMYVMHCNVMSCNVISCHVMVCNV